MSSQRNCEYFVIKYVPNVASGNDVNIGVMVLENSAHWGNTTGLPRPFVGVRFRKDWTALNRFGTGVDLEVVLAIASEINSRIDAAFSERNALFELLQELGSASNGVVLGSPQGLLTADPERALDELAARYLRDAGVVDRGA